MRRKYYKRDNRHRKRIAYLDDNPHRWDGKMIYNFKYDFLYPLFNLLKILILGGLILFFVYYLFNHLR